MMYKKLVHYIWVGANVPTHFMLNYENTQKLNQNYKFKLWTDKDILPILGEYTNLFLSSSLYHKIQFGKYLVMHTEGGVYSDFDIEWKVGFDDVYSSFDNNWNIILPKRKSLYFYNRGQKTTMLDDFVIMAKPSIFKDFLSFCQQRTERKDDRTEPFSVYALTEWCLPRNDVQFLTPEQIYDTPDCIFGYHYNKRTW